MWSPLLDHAHVGDEWNVYLLLLLLLLLGDVVVVINFEVGDNVFVVYVVVDRGVGLGKVEKRRSMDSCVKKTPVYDTRSASSIIDRKREADLRGPPFPVRERSDVILETSILGGPEVEFVSITELDSGNAVEVFSAAFERASPPDVELFCS
jgi:hypothetical protein